MPQNIDDAIIPANLEEGIAIQRDRAALAFALAFFRQPSNFLTARIRKICDPNLTKTPRPTPAKFATCL